MIKDRLIAWSPVILLLLLAILTWWLDQRVRSSEYQTEGKSRPDPDFYIEGFKAMRMNPDGTRRYELTGKRMLHYAGDDTSVLESPSLLYHDYKRAPLTVRSDTAEVESGGENVYFRGSVRVERPAFASNSELGIATSYLHVIPDQEIAKTDQIVTMTEGNTTARSVGLEFDNKAGHIRLLSQVHAHYDNPRSISSKANSATPKLP